METLQSAEGRPKLTEVARVVGDFIKGVVSTGPEGHHFGPVDGQTAVIRQQIEDHQARLADRPAARIL